MKPDVLESMGLQRVGHNLATDILIFQGLKPEEAQTLGQTNNQAVDFVFSSLWSCSLYK